MTDLSAPLSASEISAEPSETAGREQTARWQDFLALMKPRVMSLVVFTALTGLVCAGGTINPFIAAVAVFCIAVGAGASGALNMWYDADIDAQMRRMRLSCAGLHNHICQ